MAQDSNAADRARHAAGVPVERVPYVVDAAVKAMAGTRHLILVGARKPVTFFAYPNKPRHLDAAADADMHVLARPEQDLPRRWRAWPTRSARPRAPPPDHGARPTGARRRSRRKRSPPRSRALLPEDAIIADECVTFGRGFFRRPTAAAPHDWLNVTGGAIGGGMPLATGAAVGAPGRRVINLQADGSAMYTLQALWTQAREKLDVTTVLLSNRKYQILLGELANVGANPGRTALDMMDIGNPDLDWVQLADGMGVEAARADTDGAVRRPVRPVAMRRRAVPDRTGYSLSPDSMQRRGGWFVLTPVAIAALRGRSGRWNGSNNPPDIRRAACGMLRVGVRGTRRSGPCRK